MQGESPAAVGRGSRAGSLPSPAEPGWEVRGEGGVAAGAPQPLPATGNASPRLLAAGLRRAAAGASREQRGAGARLRGPAAARAGTALPPRPFSSGGRRW